jgi:hypothetical protein
MQLNVYIIATQYKSGLAKATGKPYEIHTADVLISVTDMEGTISQQVATMRMPKGAPRGMPQGNYIAEVEAYSNQTKDLAFAIRKLEPSAVKAK